jgi:cytochrome c5
VTVNADWPEAPPADHLARIDAEVTDEEIAAYRVAVLDEAAAKIKAYAEAFVSAKKAYAEACASAEKAYAEACASAEKAYIEPAEKAYEEAMQGTRFTRGEYAMEPIFIERVHESSTHSSRLGLGE